ncbi:MAG: rhodanese-like domain-containing protein [Cyanobacteria bacterium J06621_8]
MAVIKTIIIIAVSLITLGCTSVAKQGSKLSSETEKQDKIMAMYAKYARKFPKVEGITVKDLQQLQQQGQELILIDVRSPGERAVSYIPGAISTKEFESNLEQYRQTTIIAYCTIGYRSGKYAQEMQQQGVKILNLEGSLLAWSHVQGQLINAQGATNQVHVFAPKWQLIAENYEAVW